MPSSDVEFEMQWHLLTEEWEPYESARDLSLAEFLAKLHKAHGSALDFDSILVISDAEFMFLVPEVCYVAHFKQMVSDDGSIFDQE